jgi:hypothetical protein
LINDVQVCGGSALDVLATYRPDDFYLIEVFGTTIVRAYTHAFVTKEARRQALDPSVLPPTITC